MSTLIKAQQAIGVGDLKAARAMLDAHLRTHPHDLDGLYLLGVCEQAEGHADAARDLYHQILEADPDHFGARYNLALLLSGLGLHEEAMRHHDAAANLASHNPWVFVNRANSRAALRQYQAALTDYDRALYIQPNLPLIWLNKANALAELRQFEPALQCLAQSLSLDRNNPTTWSSRSGVLIRMQRHEEALHDAEQSLQRDPEHAQGWTCKAIALNQLGRSAEALSAIERAVRLQPASADAWLARGDILTELDCLKEGLDSYVRCLALQPDHAQALINQGIAYLEAGCPADARSSLERAVQAHPDNPDANWNLALLDYQSGDLPSAWQRYEHRERISTSENRRLSSTRPRWTGTPSEHPLLLWGEQGIGDQILYGSILPELASLPQRKLVALDRRLIPLYVRSLPGFEFIDLAQTSDALDFSEQLPLGSLPRYFRPSLASFATAHHPFLQADPARTAALRERLAQPGRLICGVSWSSNRQSIGRHKSISLEQMLMPLATDLLHFVDLQYGDTAAEREALRTQRGISVQHLDDIDSFSDIDGLAALIQACDVVITTSNTTAHLAGALGKETLLLLPRGRGRLWYWSDYDGCNPWYPTVRSFAQVKPGQWTQPLEQLSQQLQGRGPS